MKINVGLSLKLTLIVFLVSAIIIFSLTYVIIAEQTSYFEKAYSEKATALSQALDASIGSRDQLNDKNKLYNYILKFINSNPTVLKISINLPDENDKLNVAVSSDWDLVGTPSSEYNYVSYNSQGTNSVVSIPSNTQNSHILTVVSPIHLSGRIVGTYEMVLLMDDAYATLDQLTMNLAIMSIFSLIVLVVSFLYILRRIVIKPITSFRDATKSISEGKLDTKIKIKSRDELGELAYTFNDMTSELKKSRAEIEKYSKNLEAQVSERTKELEQSRGELKKKVDALEENKAAMLNIMWDLKKTIGALEEAEKQIKEQNVSLKDARNELYSLNRELEEKVKERTAEIEKLLKQKDEFISQLGHDLKNPLTPLVGLLPILENEEKDPKSKEHLRVIVRNVEYMRDLVIKTLQLARLNSPLTKFDIEDVNLLQEFNSVLENQQVIFRENNINVENKIPQDLFVKADKLRLDELISNLFTNAIKYTLKDSGGNVVIDAQKDSDFIIVSVKDTGIGMTGEQIGRVFDEFYKADESRHDMDSSGLGLSICKRIVEKHGGKIWAESAGLGKGSIFYFTLKIGEIKN